MQEIGGYIRTRLHADARDFRIAAKATPDTDYASEIATAIAQLQVAAGAKGGILDLHGKIGVGSTIVIPKGVALSGMSGVEAGSQTLHVGSWLCWLPASAGTVVQIGHQDQTVLVRNAGMFGIGIDGGNRADVIGLSLGSNTRTSAAFVTTALTIERFLISRVGIGIRWGTGVLQEQVDNVLMRMGEINRVLTGHPDGSAHMRVNGSNCGDLSKLEGVRFLAGTLADGEAAIDLKNCGALTLDNCFAGGEGKATRDWISVTAHNGLRLIRCQSEKYRYFMRMLSTFLNDNVCVQLDNCYIDDPISMEGTARIVSFASQIKSPILISGTGSKWDGFGDTIAAGNGGLVSVTGSGASFRNERSRRATVATVYATGEVLYAAQSGIGTIFEKIDDIVVRGGKKGTTWIASTAYTAFVERSWVASTAYSVGDRVTPSWGNGRYYRCTVAGTSGSSEPLWNSSATAAVYIDGGVTWVYGGNTAFSVTGTAYAEPTVPNDHVYKLVGSTGSHLSGSVEPTWPTNPGDTVVDNDLIWQETGGSAIIRPRVTLFGDNGTSPPTSGYFYRGHIRWNTGPDPGENIGWVCTLSGNPGLWAPWGYATRTKVLSSGSTFAMGSVDLIVVCRSAVDLAVTLPVTPQDDLVYWIADDGGTAAAHPVTITPSSGNIDGAANYVINTNYGAIGCVHADSRWTIVSKKV